MLIFLWWLSVVLLGYVFFLYPALVGLWARTRPPEQIPALADPPPRVTLVVPVYNEAGVIEEKLTNCLAIDYPHDRLEIIFASDGSTDDSVGRLQKSPDPRVTVIDFPENRGKVAVLNECILRAGGDILVLTDASGILNPEVLQVIVPHFQDPAIGCVCGIYRIFKEGRTKLDTAEHSYHGFEMRLRLWEGRIRTTLSGTGALCALRKADYVALPDGTINEDYILPARIALTGKRVIYEPRAHIFDRVSSSLPQVFRRRVRIAYGNWQQIGYLRGLLNPARTYLSWVFFSHKLLRMAVPFLLLFSWLASYALSPLLFGLLTLGLTGMLALGLAGLLLDAKLGARNRLAFIPLIFLNSAAVFVGTFKFFTGRGVRW